MLHLYFLLVLLQTASGFIVLPYIQIDYAHYFRLAQCQAKCTEKVEPDTFIKVKGLVPGVQYRFMVTAVGTNGRLGETISSPWTEISSSATLKAPNGPLTLKNGYNSDRGVIAQLEWPRSAQDSCYYKLQLSNSSTQISRDIVLDSSSSILLPHLDFDVDYTLAIAAVSADKLQTSKAVTTNFKSLPCRDIHGRGSLQCAPEPVSDLAVIVRPNGTGLISWTPSSDSQNILFYQIVYHALSRDHGCRLRKETVNIKANVNFAEVTFPGQQCEYVVRVINYDLIGRDASTEARVLIEPTLPVRFEFALRPEYLTIAACIVFLPFGLLLLFCHRRQCLHQVSEKQQKLTEYV
ncbi:hypothetical protein TELCIR_12562 [Teladorsagia circumcincta]|uniref:Fibronectin type III domain protein n=1 Tax=Teladorsagia circumcincta TaxID=45464 RepID=A0A2G9U654_TELCI|nr:hypothetical protein TELCIR_12562 [Teladorsagia circumcincta]